MKQLARPEAISTAAARQTTEPTLAEPVARPIPVSDKMSRWLVWGLAVASVAAMIWSTIHAARDCRFKPIALAIGPDRHESGTVPRGIPCNGPSSSHAKSIVHVQVTVQ
jgi:hypothetical protein